MIPSYDFGIVDKTVIREYEGGRGSQGGDSGWQYEKGRSNKRWLTFDGRIHIGFHKGEFRSPRHFSASEAVDIQEISLDEFFENPDDHVLHGAPTLLG